MYGVSVGGRLGSSVGNGILSKCPRLTANRKNPFNAKYLTCHVLVIDPVPAKNPATALTRMRVTSVLGPTARQKDRKTFSVVLHRSPSVLRKAT